MNILFSKTILTPFLTIKIRINLLNFLYSNSKQSNRSAKSNYLALIRLVCLTRGGGKIDQKSSRLIEWFYENNEKLQKELKLLLKAILLKKSFWIC